MEPTKTSVPKRVGNTMNSWRIWSKALGEKSGSSDIEADQIACIRTLIVLIYIVTNFFIIASVIRHW